jgi:hypothetical protein
MVRHTMSYKIFDFTRKFRLIRGFKNTSGVKIW